MAGELRNEGEERAPGQTSCKRERETERDREWNAGDEDDILHLINRNLQIVRKNQPTIHPYSSNRTPSPNQTSPPKTPIPKLPTQIGQMSVEQPLPLPSRSKGALPQPDRFPPRKGAVAVSTTTALNLCQALECSAHPELLLPEPHLRICERALGHYMNDVEH